MEEIFDRCCGLDVHRDSITACIMIGNGSQKRKTIKTFKTFTDDLQDLTKWLKKEKIRHVAIESTGVYWRPIFNVFENYDDDFDLWLVNARMVKNVPGRKTDVKDSEWLCRLLKCGLLSKSFIPSRDIRHLRKLFRYRQTLIRDLSRAKNRVIKELESANFKLSTVFSDVFGRTGWQMVNLLAQGETRMSVLTEYIDPRCKSSRKDIEKALTGALDDDDRFFLQHLMNDIKRIEESVQEIEAKIAHHMTHYQEHVKLLTTIPGIKELSAGSIIAEIGPDMNQFKDAQHLVSWAGLCPGNNQSAGQIKSSRIRKGNKHLKVAMNQVAWAMSRTKRTYLGNKYRALRLRRGKKRAIVAISRKGLAICFHMLKKKVTYEELGTDFLDKLEPERKAKYHAKRLEELGYHVEVKHKIQ